MLVEGLGGVERRAELLELGLRQDLRVVVLLGALEIAACLLCGLPGGGQVVAHRRQARLATGGRGGKLGLVDLEEKLPPLDLVPFLDGQIDDLPHDESREIHLAASLDLPVRRDLGEEIHLLDLGGGHVRHVSVFVPQGAHQHDRQHDRDPNPQYDLPLLRHRHFPLTANSQPTASYEGGPRKFVSPLPSFTKASEGIFLRSQDLAWDLSSVARPSRREGERRRMVRPGGLEPPTS